MAKEVSRIYKCQVKIVPYVITWDGVVTSKRYRREMGMDRNIIQSIILKKTFESILIDFRRFGSSHIISRDRELDKAVKKIYGECDAFLDGGEQLVKKPKMK